MPLSDQGLAVRVRDLRMAYPDGHEVLRGINLEVPRGQIVSLVGSNGAGKSTLLRCLVRLHDPSSGEIELLGKRVTGAARHELRQLRIRVGFVFQHFNLSSHLSAFANVLMGQAGTKGLKAVLAPLAPKADRDAAMTALERVGIAELAHRRTENLSGGQRQRVAIARMLMQRPELVLADEPVASLDPQAGVEVMGLLADIARADGLTVITTMHHLSLAERFTDRVIGLHGGCIQLDAETAGIDTAGLAALYESRPAAKQPPEEATR